MVKTNFLAFSGKSSKFLMPLMFVFQPGKVKYLT